MTSYDVDTKIVFLSHGINQKRQKQESETSSKKFIFSRPQISIANLLYDNFIYNCSPYSPTNLRFNHNIIYKAWTQLYSGFRHVMSHVSNKNSTKVVLYTASICLTNMSIVMSK